LSIVAAVIACCLAGFAASASAATVSGLVFNDFNTDGVFNTNPNDGAVDVGVGGLAINAYTGAHTLVGHTVSGSDGTYSLTLPNTRVRLELEIVRPWWPSRQQNGLRSDEQFVDASSPVTGVDFGVHQISQYSIDDPMMFWPVQWTGPVTTNTTVNPNASESAIRGAPYFTKASMPAGQWTEGVDGAVALAKFGQIGTVFGLAVDQRTRAVYAGAYYKRFAGLKNHMTGAIYRIQSGHVSLFAKLPAGTDGHPNTTDITDWVSCTPGPSGPNPLTCDTSWDLVGRAGLGSVVVDPGNTNLYTVNLFDKRLYRLPLAGGAPARTPIPDPGCVGGDWRPFAAGFSTRQLYVGGVCDAETSQNPADLSAVVYRVDNPATAPTFTRVLDFSLNYARMPGTNPYCGNDAGTLRAAPGTCDWDPWPTPSSTGGRTPPVADGSATFPLLSAITFEANGTMILGFRDLMGDMSGACIPGEGGSCELDGAQGIMIHGDLLQAGANPGGTFTLESSGVVAGKTSMGQTPGFDWSTVYPSPPADLTSGNWGYGPGYGPGPSGAGGFFYTPAPYWAQNSPSWNVFNAPFPYQGAAAQVPGFADVVTTTIHISEANQNGLLWKTNDGTNAGANDRAMINQRTMPWTLGESYPNGFAKSNGLGDLTAYTGLAPVQIGNRLWFDKNRNGLQDAAEPGVPNTIVELANCSGSEVIGKARTDRQGEYAFNIAPGTCYRVRVPLKQPTLTGWVPTRAFVGHNRRIDSSCRDVGGRAVMLVAAHGPGQNDFTYDCGFRRPPPIPPIPPQPPEPLPPNPPEPDNPGVVPPSGPLELVKDLLSRTGSTVGYRIVVRNGGPNTVTAVRVCDSLPAGLDYVSATNVGLKVSGRKVCWHVASLSSGALQTLQLKARLRPGARFAVNCATATGTGTPTVPNAPGTPVGPVRACTIVTSPVIPVAPPVTG
jgi:uncharacterized repeat protein (TIGR01451 family)